MHAPSSHHRLELFTLKIRMRRGPAPLASPPALPSLHATVAKLASWPKVLS
jgi:hypothetical protein